MSTPETAGILSGIWSTNWPKVLNPAGKASRMKCLPLTALLSPAVSGALLDR
jgi:hypothetical protein